MTPNSKSNIHCQMSTATITGVAQMKTSPPPRSTRMTRLTFVISSAISVLKSSVSATLTRVNRTETTTTCRKKGSASSAV